MATKKASVKKEEEVISGTEVKEVVEEADEVVDAVSDEADEAEQGAAEEEVDTRPKTLDELRAQQLQAKIKKHQLLVNGRKSYTDMGRAIKEAK